MTDTTSNPAPLSRNDEGIARRVAQILATEYNPQQAVPIVGHKKLRCRACGSTFSADHDAPHEGGCAGNPRLSHDFVGLDSQVQ
jgi:hypothetical protein